MPVAAEWDIGSILGADEVDTREQEGNDNILAGAGAADNLAEAERMANSPAEGKAGILSGESGESEECLAEMAVGIPVPPRVIDILSLALFGLLAGLPAAAMMAGVYGDSLEPGAADIL